jgi:2-polyprenyl-3-methyl-5-hydroxy-6-metoxy-1,4-benzoquinol methylase
LSKPRIFIGVPCYADVAAEVLDDWTRWFYHLGRRLTQYDFFSGIVTKREQFRARNTIVEAAQSVNADHLLMLDDDMIVNPDVTNGPSEDFGFLEKMLAHDKDIIGALYYQRTGECAAVLMNKAGERGYRFLRDDEVTHGLQRVDVAGGGCLLVKMKVFDRLIYPYFSPEFEFGTDVQLCRAAAAKGIEVWADTSIELGHVRSQRAIVSSRNRHQFQIADTLPGEVKKTFVSHDVYQRLIHDACQWTGYHDADEMRVYVQTFHDAHAQWKADGKSDHDWYRQFPKERVCRQVWFNTESGHKRQMTEFILSAIDHHKPLDVLDFGCGIGIPAFTLAEKGHRVTACDLEGTGTLEFLAWRARMHSVPMTFHESRSDVPHLGGTRYDVIIAMDCLEHIAEWRMVLRELVRHLKPNGVLFANNAILDDPTHAEHYDLQPKQFLTACAELDLVPINMITYTKRDARKPASVTPDQEMTTCP